VASVWLVWMGEYSQAGVVAVYARREDAEAHVEMAPAGSIEEHELRRAAATWRPYFHATGQVGETDEVRDIQPTVERRGMTDEEVVDERVATCPPAGPLGAVWLSTFGMDEGETLARCWAAYDVLRARRVREGRIPSWSDLILERREDGDLLAGVVRDSLSGGRARERRR